MEENKVTTTENEIVLYRPNETITIEVRLENDTIWLAQAQIAELFGVGQPAISKHIKNIYSSGELTEKGTYSILEYMGNDGQQKYVTKYYNLDMNLARLYGVETKRLNEAVKRNIERFPERFMFQLTDDEKVKVVTNCDHLKELRFSYQNPYAFTEQGVSMLSAVLKSDIAVNVSIMIMDAFVAMHHALPNYNQLFTRIESIEHHQLLLMERQDKTENHIESIFNALAKYELPKQNIFFDGQLFDAISLLSCINADEMINRIQ